MPFISNGDVLHFAQLLSTGGREQPSATTPTVALPVSTQKMGRRKEEFKPKVALLNS